MKTVSGEWWLKRSRGKNRDGSSEGEMDCPQVMRKNARNINLSVLYSRCAVESLRSV
jgi:hypothetical protein